MAERMDAGIKQRWLAALRSGEYKQGKYILRSEDDDFCCLGVLCDLAISEGVSEWMLSDYALEKGKDNGKELYGFVMNDGDDGLTLGLAVEQWAGLASSNPQVFVDDGPPISVAELNDQGKTFEEIADLIEEQL